MKKALALVFLIGATTLVAGLSLSGQTKASGDRCPMRTAHADGSGEHARCATCTRPCKPCPSCTFCSPGRSTVL